MAKKEKQMKKKKKKKVKTPLQTKTNQNCIREWPFAFDIHKHWFG
jgi:hypothetical protein